MVCFLFIVFGVLVGEVGRLRVFGRWARESFGSFVFLYVRYLGEGDSDVGFRWVYRCRIREGFVVSLFEFFLVRS